MGRKLSDRGVTLPVQDIYEQSATQLQRLGERLVLGDRVFKYCYNGAAALLAGYLVQGPAINTYDEDVVIPTSSTAGQNIVYATVHSTYGETLAVNALKDGYLCVGAAGTGSVLGLNYKIKSNTVALVTATTTITLYDNLVYALTAGQNTLCWVKNPYNGVVLLANTAIPIGIPAVPTTINYYSWVQTWGPCAAVAAGAITKGEDLISNDNGTVIVDDASSTKPRIGMTMQTFDSGDAGLIFLQICP